jgi:hypothetical protein
MMQFMKSMAVLLLAAIPLMAAAQAPMERGQTAGGVPVLSGGIGADSQQHIKAREKEFNLRLVFTLVEGSYLSGVSVTVRDTAGKTLVEHLADGPFFLARLPDGAYSVTAVYEGKPQVRKVVVRAGQLRTEYLRWPSNPQSDFPLPREGAGK